MRGASHHFWGGPLIFSFSSQCSAGWRQTLRGYLDQNLSPDTGWWHKRHADLDWKQPIGGAAHIWPCYQHHGFPFPYPERVIDSILPERFPDDRPWSDIFSDPRFYQTARVEAV